MTALWSSFLLVALAEMGDKTQLVALSLASWYRRPGLVMSGILLATLLNHALASAFGAWLGALIPTETLGWILGSGFIAFGIWTLVPDRAPERGRRRHRWGAFATTTVVFFLAEMGDKTQLATVALGARFHSTVLVTVGTTLGMLAADGLAVFAGTRLAHMISIDRIRWIAAALFFVFGAAAIAAALGLF